MIKKYISSQRNLFNKDLKKFFDSYRTSNILQTAMWYSLSNGGKRLRPIILAEVSKALGLKKESIFKHDVSNRVNPLLFFSAR